MKLGEEIGEFKEGVPKIVIVIPYRKGAREKALQAAKIQHLRAGMPCKVYYIEDTNAEGWIAVQNRAFKTLDFDYYVYSCDDYFPGRRYILIAYESLQESGKSLCAFNDGKWNGAMATAALVKKEFILSIDFYGGNLFFPGYKMSYGDPELTDIAMERKEYIYNPEAVFMEIDFKKETHPHVNEEDRQTYRQRRVTKIKRFG